MPSGGVRVQGLREVVRALVDVGVEVETLKEALAPIAERGASVAAGFVRSVTGALAGTLRGNRAKDRAVITAGRGRVKYAGPQNYGWETRNIEPQGFMQKADQVMQPISVGLFESAINDVIRRNGL